jgi:hypothetical protein
MIRALILYAEKYYGNISILASCINGFLSGTLNAIKKLNENGTL